MFFSGITGMNILLLEYTGNSGVELIDQIGQASVTTTSVSVTTNYNLVGSGDLALSVVTGNCSAATVPSGWTSRLSDTTQKAWVAEYVGPTQGASATAAWTGLTGATEGSSIIVCIKQTGAPIGSPTLLQMSYQVWSNPFSPFAVSPVAGNTLVITGEAGSEGFQSVSGVAGDVWRKGGSTGQDLVTGVNNATFVCSPTVGGGEVLTRSQWGLERAAFLFQWSFRDSTIRWWWTPGEQSSEGPLTTTLGSALKARLVLAISPSPLWRASQTSPTIPQQGGRSVNLTRTRLAGCVST